MDALIELLPLLAVAAYYLLRGRQRANAKRAPDAMQAAEGERPARPGRGGERAPTPFQSFMEQMEEALAEAAGEPEGGRSQPEGRRRQPDDPTRRTEGETGPDTAPVAEREPIRVEVDRTPTPSPLPAPPLRPAAPAPEFRAVAGSFSGTRPVDHERHGLAAPSAPQFGSESPLSEERFERGGRRASDAARRGHDPHGLRRPPAPRRRRTDWRAKLRDPQAARDAFVLQTLFGPRGGRHPDRTAGRGGA